jgi:hypothetical protein
MVLGSGIRDPGSGKNLFRIPDPGVKKAPDPGSGSATLTQGNRSKTYLKMYKSIFERQKTRFNLLILANSHAIGSGNLEKQNRIRNQNSKIDDSQH